MNELTLDVESFTEEKARQFAVKFFHKHFTEDVTLSAQVAERWVSRDPPVPLELEKVWSKDQEFEKLNDQAVGTVEENAAMFFNAIIKIITTRSDEFGALTFDKDDRLALEFVASASNLRMHNYHIPRLSLFDVKGIAGNIIHAIATTNAIAAGLMVIQALNILGEKHDQLRTTWITTAPPAVLAPEKMRHPNPECAVCSVGHAVLTLDTDKWTLKRFFKDIIRGELELKQPSVDVENRDNFLDIEEEISEQQLSQHLSSSSIRINDGAQVFLEDDEMLLKCRLLISHSSGMKGYDIHGDRPTPFVPRHKGSEEEAEEGGAGGTHHADDDVVMEEDGKMISQEAEAKSSKEQSGNKLSGSKRPLDAVDLTEDDEFIDKSGKRQKTLEIIE
eukprot:TRINITY_DN13253_c0_g1_i1.p1 TRINITY_DN13253_c0_g1~~TRINITY_DN13253_c0_g1_i1.p1  ORF type:complete len:390 (-),score=125.24 TRINITY_DN13253_c0_g1_i1:479-1648(-)